MALSQHRKRATREDMRQAIREGGSVMLPNGTIITSEAHLPNDVDLSEIFNDPQLAANARDDIERKMDDLKRQMRRLDESEAATAGAERERSARAAADAGRPPTSPAPTSTSTLVTEEIPAHQDPGEALARLRREQSGQAAPNPTNLGPAAPPPVIHPPDGPKPEEIATASRKAAEESEDQGDDAREAERQALLKGIPDAGQDPPPANPPAGPKPGTPVPRPRPR